MIAVTIPRGSSSTPELMSGQKYEESGENNVKFEKKSSFVSTARAPRRANNHNNMGGKIPKLSALRGFMVCFFDPPC